MKVGFIGAGHVGATAAYEVYKQGIADEIVLEDVTEGIAAGKALDIAHSGSLYGARTRISGSEEINVIRDSDILVITAGFARKPGEKRSGLALKNGKIIHSLALEIKKLTPEAVVILVTNPLDIVTRLFYLCSGFPRERVIGMGGVLDSARFTYYLAEELNAPVSEVSAMVIGEHGDLMLPLIRFATCRGQAVSSLLSMEEQAKVLEKTGKAGAAIVEHLKNGSAYYTPGASVAVMVEAIIKGSEKEYSCCVNLEGEYGLTGTALNLPVNLSSSGIKRVLTPQLELSEIEQLKKAVNGMKDDLLELKKAGLI